MQGTCGYTHGAESYIVPYGGQCRLLQLISRQASSLGQLHQGQIRLSEKRLWPQYVPMSLIPIRWHTLSKASPLLYHAFHRSMLTQIAELFWGLKKYMHDVHHNLGSVAILIVPDLIGDVERLPYNDPARKALVNQSKAFWRALWFEYQATPPSAPFMVLGRPRQLKVRNKQVKVKTEEEAKVKTGEGVQAKTEEGVEGRRAEARLAANLPVETPTVERTPSPTPTYDSPLSSIRSSPEPPPLVPQPTQRNASFQKTGWRPLLPITPTRSASFHQPRTLTEIQPRPPRSRVPTAMVRPLTKSTAQILESWRPRPRERPNQKLRSKLKRRRSIFMTFLRRQEREAYTMDSVIGYFSTTDVEILHHERIRCPACGFLLSDAPWNRHTTSWTSKVPPPCGISCDIHVPSPREHCLLAPKYTAIFPS
jgi:hypothetical protein